MKRWLTNSAVVADVSTIHEALQMTQVVGPKVMAEATNLLEENVCRYGSIRTRPCFKKIPTNLAS